MTKNNIAYMLIAGIFAIGIMSGSLAMAQTEPSGDATFKKISSAAGIKVLGMNPDIQGTIDVGNNILSSAEIGLSEASSIAESEASATAIRANLGVQNGFLVYTVTVLSDDGMQTVLVDAGNGETLHVSEPDPHGVMSLLTSGNHMVFHDSAPHMVWKGIDAGDLTVEESE